MILEERFDSERAYIIIYPWVIPNHTDYYYDSNQSRILLQLLPRLAVVSFFFHYDIGK